MISLEESYYRCARTLDLSIAETNRDFVYEMAIAKATNTIADYVDLQLFTESGDSGDKKGFITRMIEAVIKFIRDLKESIKDAFSDKEHIDIYKYMHSQTGKERLSYDCREIATRVERQITEGRKLIQQISRGTGISDVTVSRFCDGCANIFKNLSPIDISAGAVEGYQKKVINESLDRIEKKIQTVTDKLPGGKTRKQKRLSEEISEEAEKAAKSGDQSAKIVNALVKCANEGCRMIYKTETDVDRILNMYKKDMESAGKAAVNG